MRLFVAGLLMLSFVADVDAANVRKFPYEAVVDADTVFAHSGPGRKYYATSRLSRGERVRVHRHDPGGWYMIAPPAGSFSWIRADAVNRTAKRRGVLNDNNVVVRVGSALEDSRDVFQSRLSTGARVEILGEQTVRTVRGPIRMLKIVPPQGEWRWVPGQAVTPIDRAVRQQLDRDPYRVPSHARRDRDEARRDEGPAPAPSELDGPRSDSRRRRQYDESPAKREFIERPIIRSYDRRQTGRNEIRYRGPTSEAIYRDRDRLRDLDDEFRAMVQYDSSEWDLEYLHDEYVDLQDSVSHPALASQIDLRLAAVDRYAALKHNYDGFQRMAAKVYHRDRRLAALQEEQLHLAEARDHFDPASHSHEPVSHTQEVVPDHPVYSHPRADGHLPHATHGPILPIPEDPHHPTQTFVEPKRPVHGHPTAVVHPQTHVTPASAVSGSTTTHVPSATQVHRTGRLKGAGIVQRAITRNPQAPQHVLLDPNGRILAYLQGTPGVNLEQYVGQQMGVEGTRMQRPDLKMNIFVVQSLRPVNLR